MSRTTTQTKGKKAAKTVNTEQDAEIEAFPKTKKAVEIEVPEILPGIVEEKLDEDGMPIEEEAEETDTEEIALDDDDFGDRWEQ